MQKIPCIISLKIYAVIEDGWCFICSSFIILNTVRQHGLESGLWSKQFDTNSLKSAGAEDGIVKCSLPHMTANVI